MKHPEIFVRSSDAAVEAALGEDGLEVAALKRKREAGFVNTLSG